MRTIVGHDELDSSHPFSWATSGQPGRRNNSRDCLSLRHQARHTEGMSNDETPQATTDETASTSESDEELDLVSFDLNDDGKISPLEGARQEIGLIDARLEQIAKEGGVKGAMADAAHHVLDKLDND